MKTITDFTAFSSLSQGVAPRLALAPLALLLVATGCGPSASVQTSDSAAADMALAEASANDSPLDEQSSGPDAQPDVLAPDGSAGMDAASDGPAREGGGGDGAVVEAGEGGAVDGGGGDGAPAMVAFESQDECARWLATPIDTTGNVLESNSGLYARGVDGALVRQMDSAWIVERPALTQTRNTAASDGVLYAEFATAGVPGMYLATTTGWSSVGNPYTATGQGTVFTAQPDGTLWVLTQRVGTGEQTLWRLRGTAWTSYGVPSNAVAVWDTGTQLLLSTATGLLAWDGAQWAPLVASGNFGAIASAASETFVLSTAATSFGPVTTVVRLTDTGIDATSAPTLPMGCAYSLNVGYGHVHAIATCATQVYAWRRDVTGWTTLPTFDGHGAALRRGASARTPALLVSTLGRQTSLVRLTSAGTWQQDVLVHDSTRRWTAAAQLGGELVVAGNRGIERVVGSTLMPLASTPDWDVRALATSPDGSLYAAVATGLPAEMPGAHEEVRRFDGTSWQTMASSERGGTQLLAVRSANDVYWTTGDAIANSTQHGGPAGGWSALDIGQCASATSPYFLGSNVGLVGADSMGFTCATDTFRMYYHTPSHNGSYALMGAANSPLLEVGYVGGGSTRTMLVRYHLLSDSGTGSDAVQTFDGSTVQSWPASAMITRVQGVFGPSANDLRWVDGGAVYQQVTLGTPVAVLSHPFLREASAPQRVVNPSPGTLLSVSDDGLSVARCAVTFH